MLYALQSTGMVFLITWVGKLNSVINNSVADCRVLLKLIRGWSRCG